MLCILLGITAIENVLKTKIRFHKENVYAKILLNEETYFVKFCRN